MAQKEIIGEEDVPVQQHNENQTESVELDLGEVGDMEVSTGGSKPTFEKITKAVVESAVLMTTKDRKVEKDKEGNEQAHYPVYLKLTYGIDGKTAYENLGGGKLFLNDKGKPAKFWVGKDSALGKLRTLIEDNFEFKGTLKEIPALIEGKAVGIKTIRSEVAGTTYEKNLIQVFYL